MGMAPGSDLFPPSQGKHAPWDPNAEGATLQSLDLEKTEKQDL